MVKTIPSDINFDYIGFEDEIDSALFNDDDVDAALKNLEEGTLLEDADEVVDTNVDYEDDLVSPEVEDIDASDIISAERDIAFDPFEDDEVIDAAIGDDIDDVVLDDEDDIDIDELVDD